MPTTVSRLRKALGQQAKPAEPLWGGPSGTCNNSGVTQGLLSRYVACKSRFQIYAMDGLRPTDRFYAPIEYGNLWHVCESEHAAGRDWKGPLLTYAKKLAREYVTQQDQVEHWYQLAKAQFPVYAAHWAAHPDMVERTPLLQEQTFDVPYRLPSGRTVRLRGKWDSVDLVKGKNAGIWLMENKSKSQIDTGKLEQQLKFDLQVGVYLVALKAWQNEDDYGTPIRTSQAVESLIRGVRYNVVRRSQHKSVETMLKKIEDDRAAGRLSEWFDRWNVEVSAADLERFKRMFLTPCLENLADDWEFWEHCYRERKDVWDFEYRHDRFPHHQSRMFVYPYGAWNVVAEGGTGDVDGFLFGGDATGLCRADVMFPELI